MLTSLTHLLQQVLDTNPVEAFHSALKYGSKVVMQRFSILGIVKHVNSIDHRFFLRALKRKADFRDRCAEVGLIPGLKYFPSPVQNLMVPEVYEGQRLHDDGETPRAYLLEPLDDDNWVVEDDSQLTTGPLVMKCDCRFYRRWRLPCRHLFQYHFAGDTLINSSCRYWGELWEDHGFELYESSESYRELPKTAVEPVATRERLHAREVIENMTASYYDLESWALTHKGPVEGREFIAWYITQLQEAATTLGKMDFEAWKAHKESQSQ